MDDPARTSTRQIVATAKLFASFYADHEDLPVYQGVVEFLDHPEGVNRMLAMLCIVRQLVRSHPVLKKVWDTCPPLPEAPI